MQRVASKEAWLLLCAPAAAAATAVGAARGARSHVYSHYVYHRCVVLLASSSRESCCVRQALLLPSDASRQVLCTTRVHVP